LAAAVDPAVTLIGFAGAPWTVASYMVEGGSSRDFQHSKAWLFADPEGFGRLIDRLVVATAEYLSAQITAGAEAVQIFDSWAGALPSGAFDRWVITPTRALVDALRHRHPSTPIICFPREAGANYVRFADAVRPDALSVDPTVDLPALASRLPAGMAVQGNVDPLLLLAGGPALDAEAARLRQGLAGRPFIFNLGHGVVPATPIAHVERLIAAVRSTSIAG
jgi:uroporphyrinogen decarboxylase